jgi:hypothetical protein
VVARARQAGGALLLVILITFLGALACQTWYQVLVAGLASLRSEEEQVRMTALTDAAVALTLARLSAAPESGGFARYGVGDGTVSAEVRRQEDGTVQAIVKVDWRGNQRVLRLGIQAAEGSAAVIGWEVVASGATLEQRQTQPGSRAFADR